jgi:V-type H+-transporting ATPase subunit e
VVKRRSREGVTMSFFVGCLLFALLEGGFVGYVAVTSARESKETRTFKYTMFSLSVFCCWMMWALMYLAQMHPLIKPILEG